MRTELGVAVMVGSLVLALGAPAAAQAPSPNEEPAPLQMLQARFAHTATLLADGTVLVTGGSDGRGALDSAELFDPADRGFRAVGSLSVARIAHRATLLPDGRVLITGGMDGVSSSLDSIEVYDPATETFRLLGTMTSPRRSHAATLLDDGLVLISGGHDWLKSGPLRSAELLDPDSGVTTAVASMHAAREGHAAVRLDDGRVAIIGAHAGGTSGSRSLEVYEPTSQRFELAEDLAVPVNQPAAVLLDDGRILVASAKSVLVSADVGHSKRVRGRPTGRGEATLTLLEDGRALAIGSKAKRPTPVYLFDPGGDSFERLEPMRQPRVDHRSVRLQDGTVLVLGGMSCEQVSDTAEIWDPATLTSVAGAELGCQQAEKTTASPRPSLPPLGSTRQGGRVRMPGSAFAITIPEDWSVELVEPDPNLATAEPGTAWEALRATAPGKAMACSVAVGVASVPLPKGSGTGQEQSTSPRWDRKDPTLLWVPEPTIPEAVSSHQLSWVRRSRADDPDWFGAQYSLLCMANDREMPGPDDVFVDLFRSFKLLPLDQ